MHPALRSALQQDDPTALDALLTEVHPDIYSFRPMSTAWVQMMLEESLHFEQWAVETGCLHDPPNSMNRDGVILDQVGISDAMQSLMARVVVPVARRRFPEVGGGSLDDHHAFVVAYQPAGDRSLGFHVDDSDVTLNLCLGSFFSGGALYFEGRRCAQHRQTGCSDADRFVWEHQPGVALLHAGKHRHGALAIEGGERRNLIVWCRSKAQPVGDDCAPWCQESMRR